MTVNNGLHRGCVVDSLNVSRMHGARASIELKILAK